MTGHATAAPLPASHRPAIPGLAGSLLAHAVLAALLWQPTRSPEPTRPARTAAPLSVRVLPAPSMSPQVEGAAPAVVAAPARRAVRSAAPARAAAAIDAPRHSETAPASAAPQAIDGSVFGMPRITFAAASPSHWMSRPAVAAMPMPMRGYGPPSASQAHALREGSRAQIIFALERQVGALPPPADTLDAACDLRVHPAQRLDCSSEALRQAVEAQLAALSGLLQAWRGVEPRASGLSIGYREGGYRVALQMEDPLVLHARVPVEP